MKKVQSTEVKSAAPLKDGNSTLSVPFQVNVLCHSWKDKFFLTVGIYVHKLLPPYVTESDGSASSSARC